LALSDRELSRTDWTPEDIRVAAASRWVDYDSVLNGGPVCERAERVAAYKDGRRRLLRTLSARDGGYCPRSRFSPHI
jgi:hypothetical protein